MWFSYRVTSERSYTMIEHERELYESGIDFQLQKTYTATLKVPHLILVNHEYDKFIIFNEQMLKSSENFRWSLIIFQCKKFKTLHWIGLLNIKISLNTPTEKCVNMYLYRPTFRNLILAGRGIQCIKYIQFYGSLCSITYLLSVLCVPPWLK
jgi:hypothetical protein